MEYVTSKAFQNIRIAAERDKEPADTVPFVWVKHPQGGYALSCGAILLAHIIRTNTGKWWVSPHGYDPYLKFDVECDTLAEVKKKVIALIKGEAA